MLVNKPPMGWNSWNTFGENISEELIKNTADSMVELGYRDAGYNYIVIDDCWSEKERDSSGRLVASHEKFPSGMKALADYIHSRNLKFGMYSCAGVRTCADYPGSFDHEYIDAETFAEWGVDFLKYDNCYRPSNSNGDLLYRRMGMALRNSGRDILFSACNWGADGYLNWMHSAGADIYRSTGDINDSYVSMRDIAESQFDKLYASGPQCYNDMDMLICGMYGNGNVAFGNTCTEDEYITHFQLWCLCGCPLMIGGDIRTFDDNTRAYLQNKNLITLNQQEEYRPPYVVSSEAHRYLFGRLIDGGDLVISLVNLSDGDYQMTCFFEDLGINVDCGFSLELTNIMTGENKGIFNEYYREAVKAHSCIIYRAHLVKKQ